MFMMASTNLSSTIELTTNDAIRDHSFSTYAKLPGIFDPSPLLYARRTRATRPPPPPVRIPCSCDVGDAHKLTWWSISALDTTQSQYVRNDLDPPPPCTHTYEAPSVCAYVLNEWSLEFIVLSVLLSGYVWSDFPRPNHLQIIVLEVMGFLCSKLYNLR